MTKKPPPNGGQSIFPPTPSTPAKLPYSSRRMLWPAIFVLNLLLWFLWIVGRSAIWVWHNKGWLAEKGGVWLWRIPTMMGVAWLVYDRLYEADATLSAPASDPKFAFAYPFTITNPSHIFTIRNLRWTCNVVRLRWEKTIADGNDVMTRFNEQIDPGQVLNIECLGRAIYIGRPVIDEAIVKIDLEYDGDFFGWFSFHRKPPTTFFTWFAQASNPQWIRGNLAR